MQAAGYTPLLKTKALCTDSMIFLIENCINEPQHTNTSYGKRAFVHIHPRE